MRVLVVEDEVDLANVIRKALAEENFAVDVAHDGESGLFNALNWEYDVVVLDLMLPRIDGWGLLRKLREKKKTPVLILTARDAVVDRAIVDKQVKVGEGVRLGSGEATTPNLACPEHLSSGLTVVGKGAELPAGLSVGRNARIGAFVRATDFANEVPAGGVVDGPESMH